MIVLALKRETLSLPVLFSLSNLFSVIFKEVLLMGCQLLPILQIFYLFVYSICLSVSISVSLSFCSSSIPSLLSLVTSQQNSLFLYFFPQVVLNPFPSFVFSLSCFITHHLSASIPLFFCFSISPLLHVLDLMERHQA